MAIIQKSFSLLQKQKGKTTADYFVMILLVAIGILFIPFIVILLNTQTLHHFNLPNSFAISTLALIASSWAIFKAKKFKRQDAFKPFGYSLLGILLFGAVFLVYQYLGWTEVFHSIKGKGRDIISVLVIIHAFHFLIALVLVSILFIRNSTIKSSADFYIHFLHFKKQLYLKLAFIYWEFISALWIVLYVLILLK